MNFLYHPSFTSFSTLIILLSTGIYLRMSNFIKEQDIRFLTKLCLELLLPCFILVAFMVDFDSDTVHDGSSILLWSFLILSVFQIITFILFKFVPMGSLDDQRVFKALLPTSNVTFFGLAINSLFYGYDGIFVTNFYSISTRFFMYTFAYVIISGLKLTKKNIFKLIINPALLASFYGLFVFFFQNDTPMISINGVSKSVFRIDHSMPFVFESIKTLSRGLTGSLWLVIGASLNKEAIINAFRSKKVLLFILGKLLVFPIIGVGLYYILYSLGLIQIPQKYLAPTFMLLTMPIANTSTVFAINYRRSEGLALSNLIGSIIFSLLLLPFYYFIFEYFL